MPNSRPNSSSLYPQANSWPSLLTRSSSGTACPTSKTLVRNNSSCSVKEEFISFTAAVRVSPRSVAKWTQVHWPIVNSCQAPIFPFLNFVDQHAQKTPEKSFLYFCDLIRNDPLNPVRARPITSANFRLCEAFQSTRP